MVLSFFRGDYGAFLAGITSRGYTNNQYYCSEGGIYGRPDNATVREAESVIAMLEEASGALLFSSGMAAATAVFLALKLQRPLLLEGEPGVGMAVTVEPAPYPLLADV